MATLSIVQAMDLAVRTHRAGRREEAMSLCRQILSCDPNQASALHLLGVLTGEGGDRENGAEMVREAIRLNSGVVAYHLDLGRLLNEMDRPQEAMAAYQRATELAPKSAEAFGGLAKTMFLQGRLNESIRAYNSALALPSEQGADQSAQWHNALGVALAKSDRLDMALLELQKAARLQPGYAEPQANMALILQRQGRLMEALSACQRAIELQPNFANAHNTLGVVLAKLGQYEPSIAALRNALRVSPASPGICANLVQNLTTHGEMDAAMGICRRAIELAPRAVALHKALGNLLRDIGQVDDSLAAFDRAIELDPGDAMAHSARIFARHFHAGSDQRAQAEDLRLFDRRHGLPLRDRRIHLNEPDPHRPLRVGYLSPDFTQHVLAFLMLPLFSNHDHSLIQTHFYCDVCNPTEITHRFQACAHAWTNVVGRSDQQVAEIIRNDRIDILVDLTMHMKGNRLLVFARKPAPVQVTWCYPGSTGLSAIDYRLTDPHLDPPGLFDSCYSEKSVRLPDTFFCYDPLSEDPPVKGPPMIKNGFVTFGCVNNFCKINAGVLRLWAKIMCAVPSSRLLLLCPQGSHRSRVHQTFASEGVAEDRVEFVQGQPRPQYLELYHRVDISLDPLPYNGHTTSLDSFWMGVPVVTLAGQTVVGRAGLSQLTNLGLAELIAYDSKQYIDIAVKFSADARRLIELRAVMRQRMRQSPLMDGKRFARNVEAAYRQMWRSWCSRRAAT